MLTGAEYNPAFAVRQLSLGLGERMRVRVRRWLAGLGILAGWLLLGAGVVVARASPPAQATLVATVTGTPAGPQIIVPELANVRSGPSSYLYEVIGVLISGQTAPAIGSSPGREWIQIVYPGVPGNVGWVYAPNVRLIDQGTGMLPIVEPPPTATPRVTATIDPTLAAQFNLGPGEPTRLPTYTPAPPVVRPTLQAEGPVAGRVSIPPILAIAGLLAVGGFGVVISYLRGR
jgi:hypothetical protein